MNIYNTKQIKCSVCGKFIGEVDLGSTLIFPLCSGCNKRQKSVIRKGIDKILVPVDLTKKSTKALDTAIYLSKHLGASITLMKAMPGVKSGTPYDEMSKKIRTHTEKSIKQAKIYCENKNVVANHRIVKGDEAEMIVKIAKKSKYDLIIMGSSGKGPIKEIVFGSISNYVMHASDIPVLLVKEKSSKLDTKISKFRKKSTTKKKLQRHGEGIPFYKMKQKVGAK